MNAWTLLKTPTSTQSLFMIQLYDNYPTIATYVPMYKRLSRPHRARRPITITVPLYPGYIFARPDITQGEHHHLTRLPTKARFVRFGREISIIPDFIIEDMKAMESQRLLTPVHDPNERHFIRGQKIRVSFPTSDIIATMIRIIAQTKAVVDSPLGQITVPLHRIAECASM